MKICCVADLHGWLPELPPHDLLLVAGDLCPVYNHTPHFQQHWLGTRFLTWLNRWPSEKVVVWGNHDLVAEKWPEMVPDVIKPFIVTDTLVERCGLKIWGTPWQLPFCNWAFNAPEYRLERYYAAIPEDVDIIVSHGPPFGAGDLTAEQHKRVGSLALTRAVQRCNPRLLVTGHIHCARGCYTLFDTTVLNAAMRTEQYEPIMEPLMFDWENG